MSIFNRGSYACAALLVLGCWSGATGQQADPKSKELNLRAYVELLRSDLRGKKVALISEVMGFTEQEAVKFWPVYQEYQGEIAKLMDKRLHGIKDYTDNFEKMTDAKAKELTDLALQLEGDRVAVKQKYIEKIRQVLSPKLALRFLQLENQIQFLLDLQIASSLPVIQ